MSIRLFLANEFQKRQRRNVRYSLRAFARDLDVSVTALSQALSGIRTLSLRHTKKVLKKLDKTSSLNPRILWEQQDDDFMGHKLLEPRELKNLQSWKSFAILNLCRLPRCRAEPRWIATRLGIPLEDVVYLLNLLISQKYVSEKEGILKRTSSLLTTSAGVTSLEIQKMHHGVLEKALESLKKDPVSRRNFGAVVMPIDTAKIPRAAQMLTKTRIQLSRLLSTGTCDEVYALSFQLFPLSHKSE
jgi:uncharacterized protein (TIGR02147 family)